MQKDGYIRSLALDSEGSRLQNDAESKAYSRPEIYYRRDSTADFIATAKVVSFYHRCARGANRALTIASNFSIAEKHLGSRHVEHGIRHIS